MKQVSLVAAAIMLTIGVLAGDPSTDPVPWKGPPDNFQIMTLQDAIDHPDAVPNEKTPPEVKQQYQSLLTNRDVQHRAMRQQWKSKPALDAVIGKKDVATQRKCVFAVIKYQVEMQTAIAANNDKHLTDSAVKTAMDRLIAACPDVPPSQLAKLLGKKPWELCTMPEPQVQASGASKKP